MPEIIKNNETKLIFDNISTNIDVTKYEELHKLQKEIKKEIDPDIKESYDKYIEWRKTLTVEQITDLGEVLTLEQWAHSEDPVKYPVETQGPQPIKEDSIAERAYYSTSYGITKLVGLIDTTLGFLVTPFISEKAFADAAKNFQDRQAIIDYRNSRSRRKRNRKCFQKEST